MTPVLNATWTQPMLSGGRAITPSRQMHSGGRKSANVKGIVGRMAGPRWKALEVVVAWPERKRQTFDARYVAAAWQRLEDERWLPTRQAA